MSTEPDLTDDLRFLGDEVDEGDREDKEALLQRLHSIAQLFSATGWGYVMQSLRDIEAADLEYLTHVPIEAVPAHRARLQVTRKLLGTEDAINDEIRGLERELRPTEEGEPADG